MRGTVVAITCLCLGVLRTPCAAAQDNRPMQVAAGPRFLAPARGATVTDATRWVDASRMAVLQRRVSIDLRSIPLGMALRDVAEKGGLRITYSPNVLRADKAVTLRAETITVGAALGALLYDAGVDVLLTMGNQAVIVARGQAPVVTGEIVGRVTDAKTGAPVKRADVFLEKTNWRTSTDTTGRYRLTGVEAGQYTLVIRLLGYAKRSLSLAVHENRTDTANVLLEPAAVPLDELVSTATGLQRRRDIGNAITVIKADSVLRTAPIRSLTDLLANRVPGMALQHTSGAPGDPARMRLRGLGSVLRSNDPVVVVDGVRVYATQSEARSGNLTNAFLNPATQALAAAPSPLDQIDPNIIEKIEVFKGPSAATLYGADAANGVVVITTKRGKPGPARWNASLEHGRTRTLGRYPIGYYPWGHTEFDHTNVFCPTTSPFYCIPDSLVQFQSLNVPSLTVLGQGHRTAATLSVSGGTQGLTYSVTGSYSDEIGLLKLPEFEVERFRSTFNREAPDWMRRPHEFTTWGVTSNVRALLGSTADITLSASLRRTQQQRSSLENQLADLAGTYIDTVNKVYYRAFPNGELFKSAILQDYYVRTTASAINFTTGLSANWRPLSWFTAVGQVGINLNPRDDERLLPTGLVAPNDGGTVSRATGQALVSTFNLQGSIRRPLRWGFIFETNLGANLKTESTVDVGAEASGLVPGTSTFTGATKLRAFDAQTDNSVFGWYVEPTFRGQRFSLSTGLRLDGGSAYGTRLTGMLGLPKLNGSWVISEEPWFPFRSLFSSLRLRGAYGQAQVQPGPADRLRLYRYSNLAQSSVELTTLGNTRLRPERSTEVEGGFEADLLDSRLSLELTAYRKVQVDALMPVNLPTSVNGGGSVLTNIGTIRNTGVELVFRAAPVRSAALTWSNELAYSNNRNELLKLGRGVLPNRNQGIVAGYPVGGRWDRPILGYNDMNGDGILQKNEILLADSAVFMGRLLPAYTMALHTTMTLLNGAVSINGGFSYDGGATQLNATGRENWVLTRALADRSTPLSQQAAALTSNLAMLDRQHTDYGVIQEISIFRFQTFSIAYRAPATVARWLRAQQLAIAIQGDNLALHSTYAGKDPDVTAWGPGESIVDGGQLSRPTTWQLRFDLQY